MFRMLSIICFVLGGSVLLSGHMLWGQTPPTHAAEVEPAPATSHSTDGHDNAHAAVGHSEAESALHGNAGPQLEDPSEIKSSLTLWTLVVFGLLLATLWKFAWGPITAALDQREAGILAHIESAKRQNEQAAKLLADHETRLAGTADEVRRILDEARRDADAQKQKILAEAQSAADSERRRALQEIDAAKNGALRELAQQSVDTAVGLAGKIVQRHLNADDHASLITDALEKFPHRN